MWFRNLRLYRLLSPWEISATALDEVLQSRPARECGKLETQALGWERPMGRHGSQLVQATEGCLMVCLRKSERILPAAVVQEVLNDQIEEIENRDGRKVGRKEQRDMRERIFAELLPQSFTRSVLSYAYIDTQQGWMVVDAASSTKAEELVGQLRETIGQLAVQPLTVAQSPEQVMTGWLAEGGSGGFIVADECELRDPEAEGSVVRVKRLDLASAEIQNHLKAGKRVAKLALEWQERIALVLGDDLAIRRLKFLELVQEARSDIHAEHEAERFDADFSIMTMEIRGFLPHLIEQFGGLAGEEPLPVPAASHAKPTAAAAGAQVDQAPPW